MFCTKCGYKLNGNEKFCIKCGAALEKNAKQAGKKSGRIVRVFVVGLCMIVFIIGFIFFLKRKNKDNVGQEIETKASETVSDKELSAKEESIQYKKEYEDFIYKEIGVVQKKEFRIDEEDITLKDGLYYVNNPDKEKILGVLGSILTDLNGDGKKEIFALCIDKDDSDKEKELSVSLKNYYWDINGKITGRVVAFPPGFVHGLNYIKIWDVTEAEYAYQNLVKLNVFCVTKENKPYIVYACKVGKKNISEFSVSIFTIDDGGNICSKEGYEWDFKESLSDMHVHKEDSGEEIIRVSDPGLKNAFDVLYDYGISINTSETDMDLFCTDKCEMIASFELIPDSFNEISGYQMILDGRILSDNEEQQKELDETKQNNEAEDTRTAINYQRKHDAGVYENLMSNMETCFWDQTFESLDEIDDLSKYISWFVSVEYSDEIYENWYNPSTCLYEISGDIVRDTICKYMAFDELDLENYLPTETNHGKGNYWYDAVNDVYYGSIGGFGGIHDGYEKVDFEIIDYGVVKATGTWRMEDGSLVTTEIVVEEDDDLMRLKSYTHTIGNPESYTLVELEQMAKDYRTRHGLYECIVAVDSEEDDMVLIHCYEVVIDDPVTGEGHTATSDWYTVNRYTAIGSDMRGNYIDLKN